MKDKIYYYDRNNVLRLTLNEWPYYSEPSDLKDWIWGFNEQFGKINSFRRNKQDYQLVIGIDGDYPSQHDALCDIFSADVLANEPGYLMLRGWKLPCYIIEAEYEYFLKYDRKAVFKVRSINSTWIRSSIRSYDGVPGGGLAGEDFGRDYIYAYTPPKKYEGSGEIVQIKNDDCLVLTSLVTTLSPIQSGSGTPSPTNVRPISGRTEVVTHRTGKNLLHHTYPSETKNGVTFTENTDGTVKVNGTATANAEHSLTYRIVGTYGTCFLKAGTYTISGCPSGGGSSKYEIGINTTIGSSGVTLARDYGSGATFTMDNDGLVGTWITVRNGTTVNNLVFKPMIRLATDTDASYEPYNGTTYTTDLGRTVYGGKLDVVSGVLTVDRAMVTLDGTESYWYAVDSHNKIYNKVFTDTSIKGVHQSANIVTNMGFTPTNYSYANLDNTDYGICIRADEANQWRVYVKTENTTLATLKSWLAEHPLEVVYKLATPQTYQLTPKQVGLLSGDNSLWADTSGQIDVLYETKSVPFPARGYIYGYSQPESHYDSIDLPGTGNGYEIMIYGPQVNPVIYLDNQPIQVNVTLEATERLHIVSNGSVKTIEILQPNGAATDAFVYRDKEHSPFLTLGQHTDLTFGQIRFDFTTIERRSEPTWT